MTDPITASAIATLAFQEFIKGGAGELAKKFTGEAIAKMGQLRELIWSRLMGKHPAADVALEQARAGEQAGIDMIAALLGVEMLDEAFAGQVRVIAKSLQEGGVSETHIVQNVIGDRNQPIGQVSGGQVFGNVEGNVTNG